MSTTDKPTWQLAEKICEVPTVDEAIRTFVDDNTSDNAIGMVLAVLEHQAATEVAKATGTAGDLPELPVPKNISANGSSFSSDQMHEYALAAIAASQQAALPVKRYDMTTEYNRFACEDQVTAVESADGAWVKYEDHLAATNRSQP